MDPYTRTFAPLLLAEQLIAWRMWRDGETVDRIGRRLGRSPKQARAILYGDPA